MAQKRKVFFLKKKCLLGEYTGYYFNCLTYDMLWGLMCIWKCEDPLLNGVPSWQQGGESMNDGEDHMRALEELQASAGVNEDENTDLKQCSSVVSVHTNEVMLKF